MSGRLLKQIQHHRLERGTGWLCARRPPIVVGEEAGRCGRPKCLVAGLSNATKELESARADLARSRDGLAQVLETLGLEMPTADDESVSLQVEELLRSSRLADDRSAALDVNRSLTALGGRIEGLSNRPAVLRLDEARAGPEQGRALRRCPVR